MPMLAVCDNCGKPHEAQQLVFSTSWCEPGGWLRTMRLFTGQVQIACSASCLRALQYVHERLDGPFEQEAR